MTTPSCMHDRFRGWYLRRTACCGPLTMSRFTARLAFTWMAAKQLHWRTTRQTMTFWGSPSILNTCISGKSPSEGSGCLSDALLPPPAVLLALGSVKSAADPSCFKRDGFLDDLLRLFQHPGRYINWVLGVTVSNPTSRKTPSLMPGAASKRALKSQ